MSGTARITLTASDQTRAAFDSAQRNMRSLGDQARSLAGAFVGLGAGLAAAFAVRSLGSVADYADEIGKMSQRVGVATQELSGLAYAAKLSDVSNEQLSGGLKRLSKLMQEAAGGAQEQKRVLQELGVSELQDVNKAFLQLATRFSEMQEGAGKTAGATAAFGKAGADLLPLLNMGASGIAAATKEAQRFGIVVTQEAAAAAELYNDNLERLATLAQGAKIALLGDLVTGLGKATAAFLEASAKGTAFEAVLRGLQTLLTGDDQAKNNVRLVELTDNKLRLEGEIQALRTSGSALDGALARKKAEDLKAVNRELQTTLTYRDLLAAQEPPPAAKAGKFNPAVLTPAKPLPKPPARGSPSTFGADNPLQAYLLQLEQAVERTQELSAVQQAQLRIEQAPAQGFSEIQRERILFLARQIDLAKEHAVLARAAEQRTRQEIETLGDLDDALQRIAAAQSEIELDAIAQLDSSMARAALDAAQEELDEMHAFTAEFARSIQSLDAQIDQLSGRSDEAKKRALTARLEDQLQAGAQFSPEELDRIVRGIGGTGGINEQLAKGKTLAEDLGLSFSSAFEDALIGGKKLSAVLQGLGQDILRIMARKLITEPVGNYLTGALAGMLNPFGGGKAAGGPVSAGTSYLVGERGPELFTPTLPGAITPSAKMGAVVNVTINQSVGDIATVAMLQRSNQALVRQIQGGMDRSMRYGGALA